MRIFQTAPDGGKDSGVTALFLIEVKSLFSIAILRFKDGSREAYHDHAFNAMSWVLKGRFIERKITGEETLYEPSLKPKVTKRDCFHKVISQGDTSVLTIRGPWSKTWHEYKNNEMITLTHGRQVVPC
jgi:predicted metal-dependent enzyme (double-stranded beta helix superfamily)